MLCSQNRIFSEIGFHRKNRITLSTLFRRCFFTPRAPHRYFFNPIVPFRCNQFNFDSQSYFSTVLEKSDVEPKNTHDFVSTFDALSASLDQAIDKTATEDSLYEQDHFQSLLDDPESSIDKIHQAITNSSNISNIYKIIHESKQSFESVKTFTLIFEKFLKQSHNSEGKKHISEWRTAFSDLFESDFEIKSGSSLLKSIQLILLNENCGNEAFKFYEYLNSTSRKNTGSKDIAKLNRMELMRFSEIFRRNGHQKGFDLISIRLSPKLSSDGNPIGIEFRSRNEISPKTDETENDSKSAPNISVGLIGTLDDYAATQNIHKSRLKDVDSVLKEINAKNREIDTENPSSPRILERRKKFNSILSEMSGILDSTDVKRALRLFNHELEHDKRIEEMIMMYEALSQSGKTANSSSYLIFFRGFLKELEFDRPSDLCNRWYSFWDDLRQSEMLITGPIASSILQLLLHPKNENSRNGDEAFSLLRILKKQNTDGVYPLPLKIAAHFLEIFKNYKNFDGANWMILQMKQDGVDITKSEDCVQHVIKINEMMEPQVKRGKFEQSVLNLLKPKSCDMIEINQLLVSQQREFRFIDRAYRYIMASKHKPNAQTYTIIFDSLVQMPSSSTNLDRFNRFWDNLVAQNEPKIVLDLKIISVLCRILSRNYYNLSFEKAYDIFGFVKENLENSQIQQNAFEQFLTVFQRQGNNAGATKLLKEMNEKNIPMSSNSFSAAIGANVTNLKEAVTLFEKMKDKGITPTDDHFLAISRAYALNSKQKHKSYTIRSPSQLHPQARRQRSRAQMTEFPSFGTHKELFERATAVARLVEGFDLREEEDRFKSQQELSLIISSLQDGRIQFSQRSLYKTFSKFLSRGDTESAHKLIDWTQKYPSDEEKSSVPGTKEKHNLLELVNNSRNKSSFSRSSAGFEEDAEALFPNAKLLAPTRDIIRRLIVAFTVNHHDTSAHELLFENLRLINYHFDTLEYNKMILACLGGGIGLTVTSKLADPIFAERLFHSMLDSGKIPNLSTINNMIRVYTRASDLNSVEEIFNRIGEFNLKPTLNTFDAMMQAYSYHGTIEQADKLFEQMREEKVDPDEKTYRSLLRTYARAKDAPRERLLSLMIRHEITPQTVSIASIIQPLMENDKSSGVKDAFGGIISNPKLLDESNSLRSRVSFNDLNAPTQYDDSSKALKIFNEMLSKGHPPTTQTCNAVLTVLCLDSSAMAQAQSFADEYLLTAKFQNVEPNLRTFEHLIRGYGLSGDREGIESIMKFMKNDFGNLNLTVDFYNTLMYAHISLPNIKREDEYTQRGVIHAKNAFNQMINLGIRPNTYSYNIMMTAYMKAGNGERATELFNEMDQKELLDSHIPYFCLLHSWCIAGNVDKAQETFEQHKQVYQEDVKRAYAMMMHSHAQAEDSIGARTLLDRMDAEGIEPSTICYDSAIRAHSKAKDPHGAARLYKRIAAEGLRSNREIFSALIEKLGTSDSSKDRDKAQQITKELRQSGIEPNQDALNALDSSSSQKVYG